MSKDEIQLIRKWLVFLFGMDWLKWKMDGTFDGNVRYFTNWAHNATMLYLILTLWASEPSNNTSMINSTAIASAIQGTVLVMNFVTALTSWTIIHPPTASFWWKASSWQWPTVEWTIRLAAIHTAPLVVELVNIFCLSDTVISLQDYWVLIAFTPIFPLLNYIDYRLTGSISYSFLDWSTIDTDPTNLIIYLVVTLTIGLPFYSVFAYLSQL